MAGNIIPAVATTNAIVAGMIVVLAYKYFSGKWQECKTSYVSFNASSDRIFFPEAPPAPKEDCAICSSTYVSLKIDVQNATLGSIAAFGEKIGLGEAISINEGSRLLSDPDFDDNLGKTLSSLGLSDQSMLQLIGEDEDENGQLARPVVLILDHT